MTKSITKIHLLGIFLGLLFAQLCASAASVHPSLPPDANMNRDAGRGSTLLITLRLEDGEELPFLVDTGATGTVLDKSLEPRLGRQLGTNKLNNWEGGGTAGVFPAPKLYLGRTQLLTGDRVWTTDLKHPSGILGMDCLQHYCLQFDFKAGKLRFLDPGKLDPARLGRAWPVIIRRNLPFIQRPGLLGGSNTNLLLDMGCRIDGLTEKTAINGLAVFLPGCTWDGLTCSNLAIAAVDHANVIGIRFFARSLVTLDFPDRTMYLKQLSSGPLGDRHSMKFGNDEVEAPLQFLETLRSDGRLPAAPRDAVEPIYLEAYSNFPSHPEDSRNPDYVKEYFNSPHQTVTFSLQNEADGSIRHYTIYRVTPDNPWELTKAWRTTADGKTVDLFPVP
jgi:Aspartyl protease